MGQSQQNGRASAEALSKSKLKEIFSTWNGGEKTGNARAPCAFPIRNDGHPGKKATRDPVDGHDLRGWPNLRGRTSAAPELDVKKAYSNYFESNAINLVSHKKEIREITSAWMWSIAHADAAKSASKATAAIADARALRTSFTNECRIVLSTCPRPERFISFGRIRRQRRNAMH